MLVVGNLKASNVASNCLLRNGGSEVTVNGRWRELALPTGRNEEGRLLLEGLALYVAVVGVGVVVVTVAVVIGTVVVAGLVDAMTTVGTVFVCLAVSVFGSGFVDVIVDPTVVGLAVVVC